MHVGICNMHVETQHLFLMVTKKSTPRNFLYSVKVKSFTAQEVELSTFKFEIILVAALSRKNLRKNLRNLNRFILCHRIQTNARHEEQLCGRGDESSPKAVQ